jgi:hypothetical protein
MSDNNKPSGKINLYPVSAAIWRKETDKGVFYSVTFEKSYKDSSGKWQSSSSFSESDLLLVAKAANLAHDEIQEQHRKDQHAAAYVANAS